MKGLPPILPRAMICKYNAMTSKVSALQTSLTVYLTNDLIKIKIVLEVSACRFWTQQYGTKKAKPKVTKTYWREGQGWWEIAVSAQISPAWWSIEHSKKETVEKNKANNKKRGRGIINLTTLTSWWYSDKFNQTDDAINRWTNEKLTPLIFDWEQINGWISPRWAF